MSYTNKKYQAKRFCCAACYHQSMKIEFLYTCAECGKQVIRTKNDIKSNVFCDNICKGRYAGKHYSKKGSRMYPDTLIQKNCQYCQQAYEVIHSRSNSKFCSITCRAKFTSQKQQKQYIDIKCNNCNIIFRKEPYNLREYNFCSINCMHRYYEKTGMFAGKNSGTWNGGKREYKGANWRKQRRRARARDDYTCQVCGITEGENGIELSVHHIIPFIVLDDYRVANKLENLICVCESCHRQIHSGDNHPSKFAITYKDYLVEDIV